MADEVFRGPVSWRRDVTVDATAQGTRLGSATVLLAVIPPAVTVNPGFNEWFNPWGPLRGRQDWIRATPIPLLVAPAVTVNPGFNEWFNPIQRKPRNPQDWINPSSIAATGIVDPSFVEWANPEGRRQSRQDWVRATPIALSTVAAPPRRIAQYDWPVPRAARRNPQDWIQPSNPALIPVPVVTERQPRSPILWRKKPSPDTTAALSTQLGSNTVWLTVPAAPPPHSQTDWPNPTRRKLPVVADWSQRLSLSLAFVPVPAISQKDWPLPPYAARQNPQDFIGSVNDVLYYPPPPPVYDPDNTLENEIRRLRDLKNKSGRIRFLKNEVRS